MSSEAGGTPSLRRPESDESPYVGPRPYSGEDRHDFFGRDGEVAELLSLIVSDRVVMLFAVSGAGKTSLLRAGLIPALEDQGFEVLPPFRPQAPEVPPLEAENVFAFAALSSWIEEHRAILGEDDLVDSSTTFSDVLARIPHGVDEHGFTRPRLIIFDQLEEVFTSYQDRWHHREPFLRQIAAAMEDDPSLRVLLSLREDYLASMTRYVDLLPGGVRTRFHLERLRRDAALRAASCPIERRGITFAPNVAEQLVHDLQVSRVDIGNGVTTSVQGEYVEPVQLQVVCRTLWDRLGLDTKEVTAERLLALGGVDDSLIRYYDEAIGAAARAAAMRPLALRDALEQALITSAGTRASMFAGTGDAAEVPAQAVDELCRRHLVRAEWRAGGRWFELAHDRLIEPVREANRRVRERHRTRMWRLRMLAAAVMLATVGGAVVLTWPEDGIVVPSVVGVSNASQAERVLRRSGLQIGQIVPKVRVNIEPGTVFAQQPRSGSQIHDGAAVDIAVAVLPEEVTTPLVTGLRVATAANLLRDAGLSVGTISPRPQRGGLRVTGQVPAAGKQVRGGTAVDLLVGSRTATKDDDWTGGAALTVQLGSFKSKAYAMDFKRELRRKHVPAGVLRSSSYRSLKPGFWVVFAGRFTSRPQALQYENDLQDGTNESKKNPKLVKEPGYWQFISR